MNVPENINGHVYYFEPNDLDFGLDQDGNKVQLVPHLEDLCIAMSLTAEVRSRDTKNNNISEKTISWVSYPQGDARTISQQLVNGGVNLGGENYLTTYYTEISADKYIDHELVEGLGVTNVNISFESWYTPTITINFIDVHGSALWGREEAIHDNGEITSDNLLGVFFTQPYPLFRLQVKGFLGHDVTYQLSVSNFKGRYNSQTGNFEATVQFIGYSYSLLTDIPLKCLSYVSELSYVGKKYWDDNVLNNPQWQLINADSSKTPPIKLYKLIERIKNAIGTIDSQRALSCDNTEINVSSATTESKDISEENQNISLSEANAVTAAVAFSGEISEVETTLNNFMVSLRNMATQYGGITIDGNDNKYYQILMLLPFITSNDPKDKGKSKSIVRFTKLVTEKYRLFCKSLDAYNEKHQSYKISNPFVQYIKRFHDVIVNASNKVNHSDYTIKVLDVKPKVVGSGGDMRQVDTLVNIGHGINDSLSFDNVALNGNYHLNTKVKEQLFEMVKNFNDGKKSKLTGNTRFGYIFPFGTIMGDIKSTKAKLTSEATNIETNAENNVAAQSSGSEKVSITDNSSETDDWIEETRKKKIIDILGFEPTIGNFVKLMMCHLETFIEVMHQCNDRISASILNGERTYNSLGVELSATDIARGEKPYAWPALYNPNHKEKNKETPDGNQSGSNYDVLGWPNDFSPKNATSDFWEEKKVVLSIIEAIEKYSGDSEDMKKKVLFNYDGLPITGTDLFTLSSPFRNIARGCDSIEKLSPYLGIRAANVIGLGDNKCSSSDAEIIGYMDAINLISSNSKYDKLKEALLAKGTNHSFEEQVISYLTCDPNVTPTNETESGNKYNNFETIIKGSGNHYHSTRHPIFVSNGVDYTYSYIYTEPLANTEPISIIPTELLDFDGYNNPYNSIFDGQKKDTHNDDGKVINSKYSFNLKINPTRKNNTSTGVKQNFVYSCNTDNFLPTSVYTDYTNDQLLYINNNVGTSKTFVRQIEDFKKGEVKYKNYTVKGEKDDAKLKRFISRRYKVSLNDYCNLYKEWRMLIPSISEDDSDYVKEHLCTSKEEKENVTYNDAWFNTSSNLIKNKLSKSLQEKTKALKEDGSDDKLYIRDLVIKTNETEYSLFGSKFYYQQNLSSDEYSDLGEPLELKVSDKCKAYLILSSIMNAINIDKVGIFKSDNTSLIQYIQPCYVLFLGALLWRRRFFDTFKKEPLSVSGFEPSVPDMNTSFITKKDNRFYISNDKKEECYSISDYYMDYEKIDISVRNKLINLFENFVLNGKLKTITSNCELNGITPTSEEDRWTDWRGKWTKSDFKGEKPTEWDNIFDNVIGNYSSIVITSDSNGLRLLFNEKNKAMDILKELYGLNGGYIVGRATTTRIGLGNNEVKISKAQLRGYLRGFANRISEVHEEASEKEKIEIAQKETEVTRDLCVSMYYSLKHLWDTWLITSDRNEFTIENFFNKNFVFMDSFYINMFNVIKLNAEVILDAYNNKETNLLTFITHITSKEGCMFFALPSFLDSNVTSNKGTTVSAYRNAQYDMSWKKENLQNMFTPIPYNNMGVPKLNNTFVFIYTHPWSNNASENTDYRFDSYDMMPVESRPNVLKVEMLPSKDVVGADDYNDYYQKLLPNNSLPSDNDELISARYGYLMPCFGVTVNRGNNYIFKSINVNMDSPKITNVSAQTWEDILTKTGADGSKRVFFHGQDIYSIYSQYSYACEIEMMGCAQIQPLMYFQLLNIPMWRGTYMIYKVTHNMQAGMMTTKFVGMKMSRRQAPYANGYFTVGKKSAKTGKALIKGGGTDGEGGASGKFAVGGDEMIKTIFNGLEYKITKAFGEEDGKVKHNGIDITTTNGEGTNLYSPWDGYVHDAGNTTVNGNYVVIAENDKRYALIFTHCQKLNVKKGDKVKGRQTLIGLLGKTGKENSNPISPHLHLELCENGRFGINQGMKNHIDPSMNIGYIESEEKDEDNTVIDTSLLKVNKEKTDNIAIVGDSWGVGLGKYFKYWCAENGIPIKDVIDIYLPVALNSNCNKVVVCCGLNSISLSQKKLEELFVSIGKKAKAKGKTCYICKFPPLKDGCGSGNTINKANVDKLNKAIINGQRNGGYGIYSTDDVSKNNLAEDGYHLKDWSKLANIIK